MMLAEPTTTMDRVTCRSARNETAPPQGLDDRRAVTNAHPLCGCSLRELGLRFWAGSYVKSARKAVLTLVSIRVVLIIDRHQNQLARTHLLC